ncbi:hypothetical protein F5B18DRAFT_609741 [Nemania serpens]|nr:hypothetical protein F5B18DRAFT_609741 [Nemania serpens]
MHARPFFIHPYAQARKKHEVPARQRRHKPSEATADDSRRPARQASPVLAVTKMMAEMKVSLAANQLSEQVQESMRLWGKFRDEYSTEVDSIKPYVGTSVLQQIWRKKVEFNSKHKRGDKHENQQFSVQSIKLESCLNQVDEATRLLAKVRLSDHNNDYDSRQYHLKKMRAAGNLVIGLSKKSVVDEAACKDLLEELAELEKLIGSKDSTARTSHHTDNRQSRSSTRAEEAEAENPSSDRSENGNTSEPAEENSNNWDNGQDNSNDWLGNNEEMD